MIRSRRSKPSARLWPVLALERLEDRQLLSIVPSGHPVMPAMQPSVQAGQYTPLVGGIPSAYYTPAQMRTAYGIDQIPGQGQGMTIAIVDAFSQPNIVSDIATFSTKFGLPQMNGVGGNPTFSVVVPPGQAAPPPNAGWGLEISLDVEWVHAIAPYANIILVTCQNNSGDSLFAAELDGQPYASGVGYAKSLAGVVAVSNSYGGGEFFGENFYDAAFTSPNDNVAFVFSTGDSGAPGEYPAASPNVVAVGGTSLTTTSIRGRYGSESGWSGSGGGPSFYEPVPSYQSNNGVNYGARSTPDISMDADPNTGAIVYDSHDYGGGYFIVGGTSLSAPMWAGVIALGDQARGGGSLGSTAVLNSLYGAYNSPNYLNVFHDVTTGNNGYAAGPGYDLVTGIGTPKGPAVVSLLAGAAPAVAVQKLQAGGLNSVISTGSQGGRGPSPTLTISLPRAAANSTTTLLVGALTDLFAGTDLTKVKKPTSLLS